jgi:aryl-alcohol dehydrogenase-like predicted oxidoreductase
MNGRAGGHRVGRSLSLPIRRLGNSELLLTTLGLGTAAMGGPDWPDGWGAQDDTTSESTILRAVECGIGWIDTAPVYGLGHSEDLVGRVLKKLPRSDRPMVFTKCGLLWDPSRPHQPSMRVLRPDTIRREVEGSLRRLRVDVIDLYQIHQPPEVESALLEESWGEMTRLLQEGVVRAIGVSNFSVGLLDRCASIRPPDSLQSPLSMLDRGIAEETLPWCSSHGAGVIVYRPLHGGLLATGLTEGRVAALPADDWRVRHSDFNHPSLARHLAVRDALSPIAAHQGTTVESMAIAWTLAWSGVTGAIVGARSPIQIGGWLDAARLELAAADFDAAAEAIRQQTPARGPTHPWAGGRGRLGGASGGRASTDVRSSTDGEPR